MTTFLLLACQTLASSNSVGSLRRIAAQSLFTAAEEGIEVPKEAPRLLWAYVRSSDQSFLGVWGLGKVIDQGLVAEVLATLTDSAAGDPLRDNAASIVTMPETARFVTDGDLDALFAGRLGPEAAARAARVVAARHDVSPVDTETLLRYRDTLHHAADGRVRRVALELDAEIPGIDQGFVGALIADEDVETRVATANEVDWLAKELEAGWSLAILNEAIGRERHPAALAALLRARINIWEVEGARELQEGENLALVF